MAGKSTRRGRGRKSPPVPAPRPTTSLPTRESEGKPCEPTPFSDGIRAAKLAPPTADFNLAPYLAAETRRLHLLVMMTVDAPPSGTRLLPDRSLMPLLG